MSIKKSWTCSVCKSTIRSRTGYIVVFDPKTNGYPNECTPEDVHAGLRSAREIAAALPADRIAFDALHRACDPNPDSSAYWIGVERAATLDAWVRWTHHLSGKNWMGTHDIGNMLSFWYRNRNIGMYV